MLEPLARERMAVRMLYKVCPAKSEHSAVPGDEGWNVETTYCQGCGISEEDYRRFIIGDEGKL
jgi:Pyruvate/2-oxoacid:ferredoxin oxidoreductase delta subunit